MNIERPLQTFLPTNSATSFRHFGKSLKAFGILGILFDKGKTFKHTLAKKLCTWAIFPRCVWPKMEQTMKPFGHAAYEQIGKTSFRSSYLSSPFFISLLPSFESSSSSSMAWQCWLIRQQFVRDNCSDKTTTTQQPFLIFTCSDLPTYLPTTNNDTVNIPNGMHRRPIEVFFL